MTRRQLVNGGLVASAAVALAACGTPSGPNPNASPPTARNTDGQSRVMPATLGLGIVGFIVADLSQSLSFYRRLGLDVPETVASDNFRLRTAGGQIIFWETYSVIRSFDPGWNPSSGDRRIVLEFGFAKPGDVDAKYTELTAAGSPGYLPPFWQGDTVRYAIVRDPDDNQVSLRYPEF